MKKNDYECQPVIFNPIVFNSNKNFTIVSGKKFAILKLNEKDEIDIIKDRIEGGYSLDALLNSSYFQKNWNTIGREYQISDFWSWIYKCEQFLKEKVDFFIKSSFIKK